MPKQRAGLFEAPSAISNVVHVESPVGDISGMWASLANAAEQVTQTLQPALNRDAEERARRDAEAGRLRMRTPLTPEDEYYNNAMEQAYAARASMAIDTQAAQIEQDHATDPEAYSSAMEAAREAFLNEVPSGFESVAGQLWDRATAAGVGSIGNRNVSLSIENARDATMANLDRLEARMDGLRDRQTVEASDLWDEYLAAGNAAAANPALRFTPDQWTYRRENFISQVEARSIADHAFRIYEEGGANAESAADAIAMLDSATEDSTLTLTPVQRRQMLTLGRQQIMQAEAERRRTEAQLRSEMRTQQSFARVEARLALGQEQDALREHLAPDPAELRSLGEAVAAAGSPALTEQYFDLLATAQVQQAVAGRSTPFVEALGETLADARDTLNNADAPAEQRAQAERLIRSLGLDPGDDRRIVVAIRTARDYSEFLRTSPGGALTVATQHFGERPPQVIDFTNGTVNMGNMRERADWVDEHADAMMTTPEYLTGGERAALARAAQGADGLQIVRGVIAAGLGDDNNRERATAMLREIATEPQAEAFAAAGFVEMIGGDQVFTSPAAELIMEDARRRRADPNYQRIVVDHLDAAERRRTIDRMLQNSGTDFATTRETVRAAADAIFDQVLRQRGGVDEDTFTYETAVQTALGGHFTNGVHYGGVNRDGILVPNWIPREQFNNIINDVSHNGELLALATHNAITPAQVQAMHGIQVRPIVGDPGRYIIYSRAGVASTATLDLSLPAVRSALRERYQRVR